MLVPFQVDLVAVPEVGEHAAFEVSYIPFVSEEYVSYIFCELPLPVCTPWLPEYSSLPPLKKADVLRGTFFQDSSHMHEKPRLILRLFEERHKV